MPTLAPTHPLSAETLGWFTGTIDCHVDPLFRSVKYTDGIHHLRQHGLNWLVVDVLAHLPPLMAKEEFLCIVLSTKKNRKGVLSFSDGNGNVLRPLVKYRYTDCPLPELKLYCSGGILMLPTEY